MQSLCRCYGLLNTWLRHGAERLVRRCRCDAGADGRARFSAWRTGSCPFLRMPMRQPCSGFSPATCLATPRPAPESYSHPIIRNGVAIMIILCNISDIIARAVRAGEAGEAADHEGPSPWAGRARPVIPGGPIPRTFSSRCLSTTCRRARRYTFRTILQQLRACYPFAPALAQDVWQSHMSPA